MHRGVLKIGGLGLNKAFFFEVTETLNDYLPSLEMTLHLNAMVHGHLVLPSSLLILAHILQIEHSALWNALKFSVMIAFLYAILHVTQLEEVLFQTKHI